MYVHVLQFASREQLHVSAGVVMEDDRVEDCLVENDRLRLRFVAPRARAEALVERVYAHGGLTWCTRHALAGEERR